ncbi:MAG: DUF692 domain-containing protein [Methylobacteriaceae bacterium]|nr:DUF692 domain-containing protein [Methylobacteriaceae bacterium]
MSLHSTSSLNAGVGLRLPHILEVATTRPAVSWLEIHPENFLANPHATELLVDLAREYPVSVHTVGISIGSARGIDRAHLARVRSLIDRLDPFLVSGHLAWSTHEGEYLNDLLPLPYDEETLDLLARHIDEVQGELARPYLVENPSCYVGFGASRMKETEFLAELVARTGCRLLCDVSNVHVSSINLDYDPYAYLDELPVDAVGEFHLGGFLVEADADDASAEVLIDTHSVPISDIALDLYDYALARFGPQPTLIEWDSDLPDFAALLAEATRADAVKRRVLYREKRYAAAG